MITIDQIKARAMPGHIKMLRAVRDGIRIDPLTTAEARGWLKICDTLRKWELVHSGQLTAKGREFLLRIGG
jgi:hypothetical protein